MRWWFNCLEEKGWHWWQDQSGWPFTWKPTLLWVQFVPWCHPAASHGRAFSHTAGLLGKKTHCDTLKEKNTLGTHRWSRTNIMHKTNAHTKVWKSNKSSWIQHPSVTHKLDRRQESTQRWWWWWKKRPSVRKSSEAAEKCWELSPFFQTETLGSEQRVSKLAV